MLPRFKEAYEILLQNGAKFGKYKTFWGKDARRVPSGKRSTLNAKDVYPFPASDEELKTWINTGFLKPIEELDIGDKHIYIDYSEEEPDNLPEKLPEFNIICDVTSSKLLVIDCDVKNGKDGILAFKNLITNAFWEFGQEPDWETLLSCSIKTPSGGRHFYFRQEPPTEDLYIRIKADLGNFYGEQYAGLEVIGKDAVMFYGVAFKETKKKVNRKKTISNYRFKGFYEIVRWNKQIPVFPVEVLKYLQKLEEERKLKCQRQNKSYSRKFGINSDKLYAKFFTEEGKIQEGQRYYHALSLAGYLAKTTESIEEALQKFEQLLKEKTEPDYTEEPEFEALKNFIANNWEGTKKQHLKLKVQKAQEALLIAGWKFKFNENKDSYEVFLPDYSEPLSLENDKEELKELAELELDELGAKLPKTHLSKIFVLNKKNLFRPYHPLRDFFVPFPEIQGEDNLMLLFQMIINQDFYVEKYNEEFLYEIYLLFRKWLIMLYKMVHGDGYNQVMLILRGEQQIGKTYFFKHLFPQESGVMSIFNSPIHERKTDFETSMLEKMLIVLDDALKDFKDSDWDFLKGITSKQYHDFRRLHTNKIKMRKLHCSYAGTTNEFEFLHDFENKRFFVLEISKYDIPKLPPKEKIWGEVKYLAKQEKSNKWEAEQLELINRLSVRYRHAQPVDMLIADHFEILRVKNKRELDAMNFEAPYTIAFMNSGTFMSFFKKVLNQYDISGRQLSKFFKKNKYQMTTYGIPGIGPRKGYFVRLLSSPARNYIEHSRPELLVDSMLTALDMPHPPPP